MCTLTVAGVVSALVAFFPFWGVATYMRRVSVKRIVFTISMFTFYDMRLVCPTALLPAGLQGNKTFSNGSLGSRSDEERSKPRYVV